MAKKDAKCSCNPVYMLGTIVLYTLGLYALVSGFAGQINGSVATLVVAAWYFVGFLFVAFGKMLKWKACSACMVHDGKK